MLDYLKKRPMLSCGILSSAVCAFGLYCEKIVFGVGIAVSFVMFFFIVRRVNPKYILAAAILFFVCVSQLAALKNAARAEGYDGASAVGEFVVTEEPTEKGDYFFTVLEVKDCIGIDKGIKIAAYGSGERPKLGDIVNAGISIKKIDDNFKKMRFSDGMYLSGSISSLEISEKPGDMVLYAVGRLRNYISNALFKNMNYTSAAVINALVYGNSSYITDELYGLIKAAGVSHIMVVSGLHLSTVVGLMSAITEKFSRSKYLKGLIMLLTVIFMTALCGFTKSVLRAGICYIIYAVGVMTVREGTPENSLGGAVALMLILEPFSVYSLSFQLSVLSTLGIVAVASPVLKQIPRLKGVFGKVFTAVASASAVTLSAMVFTLPVTVYSFGWLSTVSVFTNLLISQAATLALTVAVLALLINAVLPIAAYPLFWFAGMLARYIEIVIRFFGGLPWATVNAGKPVLWVTIFILIAVISVLFACKKRRDVLKLRKLRDKLIKEGGGKPIWQ